MNINKAEQVHLDMIAKHVTSLEYLVLNQMKTPCLPLEHKFSNLKHIYIHIVLYSDFKNVLEACKETLLSLEFY